MNIIRNKSIEDKEFDIYVGNKEVHLLRYFEPEPGLFIAETRNVISEALDAGYKPYSLVCTEKMLDDPILDRVGDAPIYVVDANEAKKHFGYVLTGGITCAMYRQDAGDFAKVLAGARRVVVLEDVENPTNVGAIFRTAAALGFDGVLLSPACVDPLYRRAMRVSVGNVFNVPWSFIGRNEAEWQETGIQKLRDAGFTTVAMALREDNVTIDAPELKKPEKLAIIMGNEGNGLTSNTIGACDYVARIPMMNGVDSLNVAVAAGLVMWELRK